MSSIIRGLEPFRDKKDVYTKSEESYDSMCVEVQQLETTRDHLGEKLVYVSDKIEIVESDIQKYHIQEKDILFNEKVNKDIAVVEVELDSVNYYFEQSEKDLKENEVELKIAENQKKEIIKIIDEVQELENKHAAFKYYLEAIKRDGVPYELISKALPAITNEVNNILSQLVDFSMTFEMDGKNINNYIVYDNDNQWPLELSSGMEKFISSLAIRVGLINVSNLPRGNFLAIDEGWGTMDSDNINSVYNLFQYLKTQFQFTLIVSHIDSMRDAVDTLLEIKKEKGFSQVKFN